MFKNSPIVAVKAIVARVVKSPEKRYEDFIQKLNAENPGHTPSQSFTDAIKDDSFTYETFAAHYRAK